MSYDVYLELDVETGQKGDAFTVDCGNYTYNCGPMFYRALKAGGFNGGLSDLDGELAGKMSKFLLKATAHMKNNQKIYKKMNPKNGWGDYESALEFLVKITDECIRRPKCKIRVV